MYLIIYYIIIIIIIIHLHIIILLLLSFGYSRGICTHAKPAKRSFSF